MFRENFICLHIIFLVFIQNLNILAADDTGKTPKAKRIPHSITVHGHTRIDYYNWLREKENPDVVAYLEAENEYTEQKMKNTLQLQETLVHEMTNRLKKADTASPKKLNGYYYFEKWEKGSKYPIQYRRKEGSEKNELLLNINKLAEGYKYYNVSAMTISPDNSIMSFAVDTLGDKRCTIYFKNLNADTLYKEYLPSARGVKVAWANDNRTVFYVTLDDAFRPYKIMKHIMGTSWEEDVLMHHEKDSAFHTGVFRSNSGKYIKIYSGSDTSSEVKLLDADYPDGRFETMRARQNNLVYSIHHSGDKFFIYTNWNAPNWRIMQTDIDKLDKEYWQEVIPHRVDVQIERLFNFKNYLVLMERQEGLRKFRIFDIKNNTDHYIQLDQESCLVYPISNPEYDTDFFRFGFITPLRPYTLYSYNMHDRTKKVILKRETKGDYNPDEYVTKRIYATALDGTSIPISIIHSKNLTMDGQNPVLLWGYGAYGFSQDLFFMPEILSLLERGFVYALAHVRGGGEMGKKWHDEGRLLKKMNTFTDYIACAEHLINQGYTNPDKLFASGGSAAGVLVGYVANMHPDLFKGIIADVPFVDVLNSMLDENDPGTPVNYSEWGNPKEEQYYHYILKYSPYDNVKEQKYPAMLVTTGFHDSSVPYWNAAKWIAKLRYLKTDNNDLLLHTNMHAGHKGSSGRLEGYKNIAMEYAFILNQLGISR